MPGADIKIQLDDKEVKRVLSTLIGRGRDMRPPFKRIVAWMQHSTAETFRAEGRPTGWKPLSSVTLALRRKGPGSGRARILQDTGRLRMSVTGRGRGSIVETSQTKLALGTTVRYAPDHQFGRPRIPGVKVKVPAHTRKPHTRRLPSGRKVPVRGSKVRQHMKTTTLPAIPARPFLQWLPGDVKEALRILSDYMILGRF